MLSHRETSNITTGIKKDLRIKNKYVSQLSQVYLCKSGKKRDSIDNKELTRLHFSKKKSTTRLQDTLVYSDRNSKEFNSRQHKTLTFRRPSKFSRKSNSHEKIKAETSTLMSSITNNTLKQKQGRKKFEEGKCCRIVLVEKNNEIEHFLEVGNIKSVMNYLKTEYPRNIYYKCIPNQITLDYLLMEGTMSGEFLNGQTLYLTACEKANSMDDREEITLNSFEVIKLIGSGGFSKVFLCRFRQTGEFYAMKVIDKDNIIKNKKKRIIMNERNIMKKSKHPFIIDMKYSLETEKHLIFVMEYCVGGELFGLIKRNRRISEQQARFYIIQILQGLSYLHGNNVVYRDIKPENILLGQDGHVKIADLGLAKPNMFEGELAYSFCGSPEYMSPEMILQVGHTYPVDFYCMGALLYELLIGLPPYYSRDPEEIYEAVLSEELYFPQEIKLSSECKSLIKGLLCKESKQRLGSIHGVKEILAHPWFGKKDYKEFLEKKIRPPETFDSISRIDLDREFKDNSEKEVEQLKKEMKRMSKSFKIAMKNFYFNHDSNKENDKERANPMLTKRSEVQFKKNYHKLNSELSGSSLKKMRKKNSMKGLTISNNIDSLIFTQRI